MFVTVFILPVSYAFEKRSPSRTRNDGIQFSFFFQKPKRTNVLSDGTRYQRNDV
jgi:hypothetical protein